MSRGPSRYGRWRAATLIGVYVLMGIHIAHWRLNGSTLAPLELNEVMYTLEVGIVTAGAIFMGTLMLATAFFGRFFCSWGCHILALQDLCAWLLGKIGIRPKPVRSRVLLFVAPAAMIYMFIWPQISRLLKGQSLPALHLREDAQGWASFVTDDFWRNLPSPAIALLTFAVCGFVIVYILGSRSFCSYACPYGVLFGIADRVAPGRIRVDADKCTQCGHCTAVCESHVRVHEEIDRFGSVVDSWCLKDLDCVSVCPENALSYGLARPSLLRSLSRTGRRRLRFPFTLVEEGVMAVTFLAVLLIFRGLYGHVPFLMALGLGGIAAYLGVLGLRVARLPNVRLNNFQLKRGGRLTRGGAGFTAFMMLAVVFVVHSGFIRYHEVMGDRAYEEMRTCLIEQQRNPPPELVATSLRHASTVDRWGLIGSQGLDRRLASLHLFEDPPVQADRYFRRHLAAAPHDLDTRLQYAEALARMGRLDDMESQLKLITIAAPQSPSEAGRVRHLAATASGILADLCTARGEFAAADAYRRQAAQWHNALVE